MWEIMPVDDDVDNDNDDDVDANNNDADGLCCKSFMVSPDFPFQHSPGLKAKSRRGSCVFGKRETVSERKNQQNHDWFNNMND